MGGWTRRLRLTALPPCGTSFYLISPGPWCLRGTCNPSLPSARLWPGGAGKGSSALGSPWATGTGWGDQRQSLMCFLPSALGPVLPASLVLSDHEREQKNARRYRSTSFALLFGPLSVQILSGHQRWDSVGSLSTLASVGQQNLTPQSLSLACRLVWVENNQGPKDCCLKNVDRESVLGKELAL